MMRNVEFFQFYDASEFTRTFLSSEDLVGTVICFMWST